MDQVSSYLNARNHELKTLKQEHELVKDQLQSANKSLEAKKIELQVKEEKMIDVSEGLITKTQ